MPLDTKSPWEKMQEKNRLELELWQKRVEKAKLELRYAEIKVSTRKYRLIQWDGIGFAGNELNPHPRFIFVTRPLNFEELERCWGAIYTGKKIPEDYLCSEDS